MRLVTPPQTRLRSIRFHRVLLSFLAGRRRVWTLSVLGFVLIGSSIGAVAWWELHPQVREAVLNANRWPQSTPAMRTPGRLRVLFLGNSLTAYNGGLALILEQLSTAAGKKPTPIFDQVVKYGATWAQLWDVTPALDMIRQGRWDYVVLQDFSTAPLNYRAEMDVYGARFSRESQHIGARPMFFMTWAHQDQLNFQHRIAREYTDLALANHGLVVPVGIAWQKILHDRPGLVLYDPRDKPAKHPTPAGSYLTACLFYSMLYHESARGLTGRIVEGTTVYINLNTADAMYLQDVAWKTVREMGQLSSTRPVSTTRP